MNTIDWKKLLQNAGFDQVSNIRSVQADALDSAEGYAATTPGLLGLSPTCADALENALYDAQITYVVRGDRLYVFASEAGTPTEISGLRNPHTGRRDVSVELHAGLLTPENDILIFASEGRGVALQRSTQNVVRFEYIATDASKEQTLSADAFVSAEDDPWLHSILDKNFQTKRPLRMLWALGAYLRYRAPDLDAIRHALENNEPIRSTPQDQRARTYLQSMRADSGTLLERIFFADAQELYDALHDAYNDALAGNVIEEEEWLNLCLEREALTIRAALLPTSDTKNDAYALAGEIDSLGDLLLIESNVSEYLLDAEPLRRGVRAGDHTWWLRPHATHWPDA